MRFASALSLELEPRAAVRQAVEQAHAGLGGAEPDLALVFVSDHHRSAYGALAGEIRAALPRSLLLGCSARSVIGAGREVEEQPALSLIAAELPDVTLHPLRLEEGEEPDLPEWREQTSSGSSPHFILLPDPWSFDAEPLIEALDASFPAGVKIGGLASGAEQPGQQALFLDAEIHAGGLVGVALHGDLEIDSVVAQGCRPIGSPMFVTRARENLLFELDGKPPLVLLQGLFEESSSEDQDLFRTSLFLGLEMRDSQSEYRHGDFLIRNLIGADPESHSLAVAGQLHDGQVVQFHLRDAAASAADLEARLADYQRRASARPAPAGALLFSCLGRGQNLYGRADCDTDALRRHLGDLPLGGFFCNGEIGPVQQQTFLHGYTSAFGLFRRTRGS